MFPFKISGLPATSSVYLAHSQAHARIRLTPRRANCVMHPTHGCLDQKNIYKQSVALADVSANRHCPWLTRLPAQRGICKKPSISLSFRWQTSLPPAIFL